MAVTRYIGTDNPGDLYESADTSKLTREELLEIIESEGFYVVRHIGAADGEACGQLCIKYCSYLSPERPPERPGQAPELDELLGREG